MKEKYNSFGFENIRFIEDEHPEYFTAKKVEVYVSKHLRKILRSEIN